MDLSTESVAEIAEGLIHEKMVHVRDKSKFIKELNNVKTKTLREIAQTETKKEEKANNDTLSSNGSVQNPPIVYDASQDNQRAATQPVSPSSHISTEVAVSDSTSKPVSRFQIATVENSENTGRFKISQIVVKINMKEKNV